jgi:hypothetical protein
MLAGRVKSNKARDDADCYILESLVKFFERQSDESQLLLCTENLKEFAIDLKDLHFPQFCGFESLAM